MLQKISNNYLIVIEKQTIIDYNEVIESLANSKNVLASYLKETAYDSSSTLIQRASNQVVRPYSK